MSRIYCAGPLFNDSEKEEMRAIANFLEKNDFSTFLPQRDGLEFVKLRESLTAIAADQHKADRALQRAIFALDIFECVEKCDGLVANLNGRVPDEGTVVEASLAWHSGKALVLYKTDVRTILGGHDHPLLTGLTNFRVVGKIAELPVALKQEFTRLQEKNRVTYIQQIIALGNDISKLRVSSSLPSDQLAQKLWDLVASSPLTAD